MRSVFNFPVESRSHDRLATASRSLIGFAALVVFLCPAPGFAADEGTDLTALAGKRVKIALKSGKSIEDAEVTGVIAGEAAGSAKVVSVKLPSGQVQKVTATTIEDMFLEGETLDIVFDLKSKTISHSPDKRRERLERAAAVLERLEAKRARLWPELSEEELKKLTAEQKTYLETVSKTFNGLGMKLYETKFFLFLTDMPADQVSGYIAQLDQMYAQLCEAFTIPKGKNIWHGKCVVVAFVEEAGYREFEQKIMNNTPPQDSQGIAHSYSDGRVIVACYRGNKPSYFAVVLVHETAHGFVHRYKSSVRIPSWINEGISDWVAGYVVRLDGAISRRQQTAAEQARQNRSLGGNFFDATKNIEFWQYGVASGLVDLMLKAGPKKYRALIDGIKEGLEWEDSLKQAYGLTPAELAQLYGRAIGVNDLRP